MDIDLGADGVISTIFEVPGGIIYTAFIPYTVGEEQSPATRIKHLRYMSRKSIREVATAIGYSNPYISQVENGQVEKPSADFIMKIAAYFQVSIEFIMGNKNHDQ